MKKNIKIILLALLLGQSPVLSADSAGPDGSSGQWFGDDVFSMACAGVILAGVAYVAISCIKNYFGKTKTGKTLTPGGGAESVGFENPGLDCYLNSLLTTLLYTREFASFLLEHKREISNLFVQDAVILKLPEKKAKLPILSYVQRITGIQTGIALEGDVCVWDNFRELVIEKSETESEFKPAYKKLLKKTLLVEMLDLAIKIHGDSKGMVETAPIDQSRLRDCLCALAGFSLTEMQDPGEAADTLFDALELIKDSNEKIPALHKLLGFDYWSKTTCLTCNGSQEKAAGHFCVQALKFPFVNSGKVGFNSLLDNSMKSTRSARCCSGSKNCEKIEALSWKSFFTKLPKLLFFQFARGGENSIKNSAPVIIPETFNAGDYISDGSPVKKPAEQNYRLCAIISHGGLQSDGGHYTSLVKTCNGWRKFNDRVVSKATKEEVGEIISASSDSAMVLYQKTE